MKMLFLVGAGSFIGGMIRFLLSELINNKAQSTFPYGTFVVNIIGCLAIGLVYAFFEKDQMPIEWKMFLATGILGGFTTFSAFSMETFSLLRTGNLFMAIIYVTVSIVVGILATATGYLIIKAL